MQLRIATFNIRNGRAIDKLHSWPFRRNVVAETIQLLGADIIGLQEAFHFQRKFLSRKLPNYSFYGDGRAGGVRGEGCPLLSSSRFEVQSGWTRWFSESESAGSKYSGAQFPRIATSQYFLDENTSQKFRVINTHLDAEEASLRLRSVEKLMMWNEEETPTILIGDFNCGFEETAVFDVLHENGFEPLSVGVDTSPGFARSFLEDRPQIDHILFSKHWEVDAVEVVDRAGRPASDHLPVVADVSLK